MLLPPMAKIHDVFHVSQLKRYEGKHVHQVQCDPPTFWELKAKEPATILERRMIKRGNCVVTQFLSNGRGRKTLMQHGKIFS